MISYAPLVMLLFSFCALLESFGVNLKLDSDKIFQWYEKSLGIIRCRIPMRRLLLIGTCYLFFFEFMEEQFEWDLLFYSYINFFMISVVFAFYHFGYKSDKPNRIRKVFFIISLVFAAFFLVGMFQVRV